MSFSCRFSVEAKEFQVSVLANGVVKMSEWSWKAMISIFLGRYGAVWIVNLASRLQMVDNKKEVVVKFNEASRGFLAQRCSNKAGRYVAVAEFGGGRRKGVVMILEGKEGAGWKELADVFQEVVSHLSQPKRGREGSYGVGVCKEVSLVDVVKKGQSGESSRGQSQAVEGVGAFNAEAAGGEALYMSLWRKKLLGIRKELDDLLELMGGETGSSFLHLDPDNKAGKRIRRGMGQGDRPGPFSSNPESPDNVVLNQLKVGLPIWVSSSGLKPGGPEALVGYSGALVVKEGGGGVTFMGQGRVLVATQLSCKFLKSWSFEARLVVLPTLRQRSTNLDSWTPEQLKMMSFGGNNRAQVFFKQHGWTDGGKIEAKYTSRAADLYRQILSKEVAKSMAEEAGLPSSPISSSSAQASLSDIKTNEPPKENSLGKQEIINSSTTLKAPHAVVSSTVKKPLGAKKVVKTSGLGARKLTTKPSENLYDQKPEEPIIPVSSTNSTPTTGLSFASRFEYGSAAISSSDLFGDSADPSSIDLTSDLINRLSFQAQQDISNLKNIAGETGKKLSSLASTLMTDLQDRIL
ncbi:putative ADP-ribosylation factor GTPase-activating protein AGD8 [Morella rubra]|uniref:Putative ADP-ribosylation factor GTPase-activating protein AGD8 n=1 Tax=Morella rubra TaxID=262757 RepID=A0A6A1VZE0_9ROSI|nr:putative ADP-ribosylation factor GTPase-activating protein AGD8 [Morella rubra]